LIFENETRNTKDKIGSHIIACRKTKVVTNFFLLILSINFGDSSCERFAIKLGTDVNMPICISFAFKAIMYGEM